MIASAGSASGTDTLCLRNFSRLDLLRHAAAIANAQEEPDNAWPALMREGVQLKSASQGFTDKIYWLTFTLKNCASQTQDLIIELANPQIDIFTIYEVSDQGKFIFRFETGDRFPFAQRLLRHRHLLVPLKLETGESKTFLFKIDKRNSSVSIPLYLWDRVAHREKDYKQNLGFGLYLGFMALCVVYSLFTFFFLRTEIYWWYTWWIVLSGLFGFTALGLSHQYLYPELADFNSKFRVYLEITSIIAIIRFLHLFLKIDDYVPKLAPYLNGVVYLLFFFLVITPFFQVYNRFVIIALPTINIVMFTGVCLIIYAAIRTYRLQKQTVLFFFAAFGATIAATATIILAEFGYLSMEDLTFNPYLLSSGAEVLLFSMALSFQIKKVYEERNELSGRMARHQKEMMQAYVEGVEKERSRIAGELHDDIGSRLGNLRRIVGGLQHDQKDYLEQQVEKLSTDVRSLSHQLAPAMARKGLAQAAEELILDVKKGCPIKFSLQCYDVPDHLPEHVHQQCYRMLQEIINNIVKHSKATMADIQLFGHDGELAITIEDDGVGFDINTVTKNLGLRQLQARTESIQGTMELSSSPGNGTQVMIRVPLIKS